MSEKIKNEKVAALRKAFTLTSIITLALVIIILILSLFKVFELSFSKGDKGYGITIAMLCIATICACSFFETNALNVMNVNKPLAITGASLLLVSTIGALIIFISGFKTPELYNKILAVIAIASVLFVILISSYLKLGKHYIPIQVITYVLTFAIDVVLTIQIFGGKLFNHSLFVTFFVMVCLIVFALLCTINILGKKVLSEMLAEEKRALKEDKDNVTISKEEYEYLVNRVKELEEKLNELEKSE